MSVNISVCTKAIKADIVFVVDGSTSICDINSTEDILVNITSVSDNSCLCFIFL